MIIVTTETISGKKIKEVKGFCKGSTVQSKHFGKDIGAGFKNLIGGELKGYQEMLVEARQIAVGRMVEDAEKMGANAIIAMRLQSSSIIQGASEMIAYGTAVIIE